jgi:hypothetical protein
MFSFDSNYGFPDRPIQASDGNFYGLTAGGYNLQLYKMTPDGSWTILVSFDGTDVDFPWSALVMGTDGNFYGTSIYGGDLSSDTRGGGTIFRIVMPPPPPSLTIAQSGNHLVLSWPTNADGFTLQSAPSLDAAANWVDSTDQPAIVGDQYFMTNNISGAAQFYRLKHQ